MKGLRPPFQVELFWGMMKTKLGADELDRADTCTSRHAGGGGGQGNTDIPHPARALGVRHTPLGFGTS